MSKIYDLIIIGAGPAGITAGIYAKNFGLDCLIVGEKTGGLVNSSYKVENYPGIFNISGKELTKKFKAHQKYLKVPFKKERAEKISKDKLFTVFSSKKKYQAKSLILAFGTEVKRLKIKNIERFEGKGVSYQADNDAFLFKNKIVAVIGGANAAAMTAVMLAQESKKVYLIYRRGKLRANIMWQKRVKRLKNIEVIYNRNIIELEGGNRLEKIVLDNEKKLGVNGLIIKAGCVPNTFLIKGLGINTDKQGYIKVGKTQATNIKGIFAAGDATIGSNEFRQIITACSEAAIAVLGVFNFLNKK